MKVSHSVCKMATSIKLKTSSCKESWVGTTSKSFTAVGVAHKQLSRRLSVPALNRGFKKEGATTTYSPDYPANEFWRKFRFSSLRMQEATFDMYYRLMDNRLREGSGFSAVEFYYFMKLAEERDSFTPDEAIVLLQTTGFQNKYIDKAERIKWTHYLTNRFRALGMPLDVRYYNQLLTVYDKNQYEYSPVEFLSQIEADGVTPNRVMLTRFIQRYCAIGDMKSASQILEHMKMAEMPISLTLYNSLIRGHFNAGDPETAMKMFEDTRSVGFEPDAGTYYSAIVGNALLEDMPTVKRLFTEAQENNVLLSDGVYSSLIEQVAARGLTNFVEYFLSLLKAVSTFYYNEAHDTLQVLMKQGNYELAYRYFDGLSDPSARLFYNPAIITKMPIEEVVKYSRRMKERGCRMADLTEALDSALNKFDYDACVQVLPYLRSEGEELRSQYIWPFICYYRDSDNMEGMKKLLPLCFADKPTILEYLNPALIALGVDTQEYPQLLKEHTAFSDGLVNTCHLAMVIQKDGVEAGLEAVRKFERLEGIKDFGDGLTPDLIHYIKNDGDWKTALKLISVIESKMGGFFNPHDVVIAIASKLKKTKESAKVLADGLSEMGIMIDSGTARFTGLTSVISKQELDTITFERDVTLDNETMKKMETRQLERIMPQYRGYGVRNHLINRYYQNKDWKSLESLLMDIDLSTVLNFFNLECLAMYFLYQKADPSKAGKCLLNIRPGNRAPWFHLVYNTATRLAAAGQYTDAKAIVSQFNNCRVELDSRPLNLDRCHFFDRDPTPEHVEQAHEMFDALLKNGFILKKNSLNIMQTYTSMVANTCDADQICKMADALTNNYDMEYSLVPLLAPLIQKDEKACLQKVFDHLSKLHSERKLLISLAAAFLQEGKMAQARKVLATPGLRCNVEVVDEISNPWAVEGEVELLEKFYSAIKDVRGAEKKRLIFNIFKAMCNKRPTDVDACIAFFDSRFEDEGVFADRGMLKFYANFLKARGRQIHFAYDGDQSGGSEGKQQLPGGGAPQKKQVTSDDVGKTPAGTEESAVPHLAEMVKAEDYKNIVEVLEELSPNQVKQTLQGLSTQQAKSFWNHLVDQGHYDSIIKHQKVCPPMQYAKALLASGQVERLLEEMVNTRKLFLHRDGVRLLREQYPDRMDDYMSACKQLSGLSRALALQDLCTYYILEGGQLEEAQNVFQAMEEIKEKFDIWHMLFMTRMLSKDKKKDELLALCDMVTDKMNKSVAIRNCLLQYCVDQTDLDTADLVYEKAQAADIHDNIIDTCPSNLMERFQTLEMEYQKQKRAAPWGNKLQSVQQNKQDTTQTDTTVGETRASEAAKSDIDAAGVNSDGDKIGSNKLTESKESNSIDIEISSKQNEDMKINPEEELKDDSVGVK